MRFSKISIKFILCQFLGYKMWSIRQGQTRKTIRASHMNGMPTPILRYGHTVLAEKSFQEKRVAIWQEGRCAKPSAWCNDTLLPMIRHRFRQVLRLQRARRTIRCAYHDEGLEPYRAHRSRAQCGRAALRSGAMLAMHSF